MKKQLLLFAVLLLLLSSCGKKAAQPYNVTEGGRTYTVDPQARTVTQGEQVYHYSTTENSITITYPDGTTHRKQVWFNDNAPAHVQSYSDPLEAALFFVLTDEYPQKSYWNPWGILLGLWGLFPLAFPEKSWQLSWSWRYRDAEPSENALVVERLKGGFLLLLGLLVLFSG